MPKKWILLFLLTAGCSSLGLGPSPEPSGQLEELKARVLALQQQAAVDQLELKRLQERLDEIESKLAPPPPAEPRESAVRGIGDEEVSLSPPGSEIESTDLEEEPLVEISEPAPAVQLSAAAQALYDRGYTQYHQGRYLDAERTFTEFLEASAGSELGDNAQYWIGESRIARQELQAALAAFRETVRRYPDGNKTPDALYKAGTVLEALGDVEAARLSYRELQNRFPDSTAAADAAERLRNL